jgi:hypothetical protein
MKKVFEIEYSKFNDLQDLLRFIEDSDGDDYANNITGLFRRKGFDKILIETMNVFIHNKKYIYKSFIRYSYIKYKYNYKYCDFLFEIYISYLLNNYKYNNYIKYLCRFLNTIGPQDYEYFFEWNKKTKTISQYDIDNIAKIYIHDPFFVKAQSVLPIRRASIISYASYELLPYLICQDDYINQKIESRLNEKV